MNRIEETNLTADDMLDLIQDMQIDIVHTGALVHAQNWREGIHIIGKSKDGISEAIRSWARKYNELS